MATFVAIALPLVLYEYRKEILRAPSRWLVPKREATKEQAIKDDDEDDLSETSTSDAGPNSRYSKTWFVTSRKTVPAEEANGARRQKRSSFRFRERSNRGDSGIV